MARGAGEHVGERRAHDLALGPAQLRHDDFVVIARLDAPIVHADRARRMLDVCRRAGFAPAVAFESSTLTSLLPIVGAGLATELGAPVGRYGALGSSSAGDRK